MRSDETHCELSVASGPNYTHANPKRFASHDLGPTYSCMTPNPRPYTYIYVYIYDIYIYISYIYTYMHTYIYIYMYVYGSFSPAE